MHTSTSRQSTAGNDWELTASAEQLRSKAEDDRLVARILEGDQGAFDSLVERHGRRLLNLAMAILGNPTDAQDVVQETWIGVYRGLVRFQYRSTLKTWITRILINQAYSHLRRERRYLIVDVDPDRRTGRGAPGPRGDDATTRAATCHTSTPEQHALDAELRGHIDRSLEQLPPRQRTVVQLRDLLGYSAREVCGELELSEVNQRVLLHRGRARMRSVLSDLPRHCIPPLGWQPASTTSLGS